MSVTPAAWTTARTAPPAMTPVPGLAGLAGGVGQCPHPAVILVASAVEANLVNTGLLRPLGDQAADDGRRRLVPAVGRLTLGVGVERAGRREGQAGRVVDHLGVDVL